MRRNFFSEDFVRVIAGQARGLSLDSPSGLDTRPTLDRVKEAVFSMLLPYLSDALVLDLFAGSGALGIESLSRGSLHVTFVDDDNSAISCINSNLLRAKMTGQSDVLKINAIKFLEQCSTKFDLIFIDPPYSQNLYQPVLKLISENRLLSNNGLIIVEWDYDLGLNSDLFDFQIVKEKKYGRVGISVLKWGITE